MPVPSPYRESDDTPAAPLEELEWRRRVTRSALWAELLAVGDGVVLLATSRLPARFAFPGAVAWLAISAALAVATWMYTAPRPRSAVGWRGWLLRASVPLCLGVTGLLLLGMHLEFASYILGALLVVAVAAATVYTLPFNRRKRFRSTFREWLVYGAGIAMVVLLPDLFWQSCGISALFAGNAAWLLRLALLPIDQEWWFDNQTGTPGEWVSLHLYDDHYAQVLFIDGRPAWFASKYEAAEWLEANGYVPAERALAEHLVDSVPPDILPVARRRKRLRVQENEPRVRVEADTWDEGATKVGDGAVDELDESAAGLDRAEPPRTLTAENPHEH